MPPDLRWLQRFANVCQALDQLETFFQPPALNERERQGLIGSRDTLRLAFRSTAEQVSEPVGTRYLPCFQELRLVLSERVQATAAGEGHG
jgi:hypothetical protein